MSQDLNAVLRRYPNATTFTFGDSRELCDGLIELVRQGKKTATCDALQSFESEAEAMPVVGRRDIALDWDGRPALVLETESVDRVRFCDVEVDFALAEGEDEDLAGWQRNHQAYFERSGGFDPKMILVCERFRLVEDLGRQDSLGQESDNR
ncbi:MAG: ASCH domain-containing protein [Acidobacteriota bacterium]